MPPSGLMYDIIFKIVFGNPQDTEVLRLMLNALLELSGSSEITHLEVEDGFLPKDGFVQRGAILDIHAHDRQNRRYNIEMQVAEQKDYIQRSLFYLSRLFSQRLNKGQPFGSLARTIGISLLDFELFPAIKDYHSSYRFYDVAHQRELSDIMEIHYIELSKLTQSPANLETPFGRWVYLLKFGALFESEEAHVPEPLVREKGIMEAVKAMRYAYASDEVRAIMEARDKAERDEGARLYYARQEGEQVGRENTLRDTARKLLAAGASADLVLEATGLSAADLSDDPPLLPG